MAKAEFIAARVHPHILPGARHLDIACGDGQILCAFSQVGCRGIGVELSKRRLARCRQKGLSVVCADMSADLPFRDAAFDLVTLISTIEHIPHPNTLLEEVDRVLSTSGLVAVQIPNPYFPIDLHYFLPFYGYLPPFVQEAYRRLVVGHRYAIDYYTAQVIKRDIAEMFVHYSRVHAQDIVYPLQVAPDWLKPFYGLYRSTVLRRLFPTGHLFVYQKV
jgi:ubiquinone/menaquinone biosynthesis C-methylase UbiE